MEKICENCQKAFIATDPTQEICPKCKDKKKSGRYGNKKGRKLYDFKKILSE